MIVPISQAGKHLNPPVTRQALSGWIKAGCDAQTPEGLIDTEKAQAWRERYRPDPDKARRPGAGRPKTATTATADPARVIRRGPKPTKPVKRIPLPLTVQEILDRNERGEVTPADLDQTRDLSRVVAEIRENERAAGKLIDVADAELAWGELLLAFKDSLDALPERTEARACAELMLEPSTGGKLREIVAEELRTTLEELTRGPSLPASSAASSKPRRR